MSNIFVMIIVKHHYGLVCGNNKWWGSSTTVSRVNKNWMSLFIKIVTEFYLSPLLRKRPSWSRVKCQNDLECRLLCDRNDFYYVLLPTILILSRIDDIHGSQNVVTCKIINVTSLFQMF